MKNGQRNGYGVLKNEQGNEVFKGNWKDGEYHYWGILNNVNSKDGEVDFQDLSQIGDKWRKYEGNFKVGIFQGYGQLDFTDGS